MNLHHGKNNVNNLLKKPKKIGISELFKEGRATTTIKLTIMATTQVASYFGLMNWLPSILQKKVGISISGSSIWMIATIVGMSLGMLVFGQIMDKLGAKKAYASFLIASALVVYLYSFASSNLGILIGGLLCWILCKWDESLVMEQSLETFIRHAFAQLPITLSLTLAVFVGGFSSVAIGFFLDNYSLTIAMLFLSGLYCVSLITVLSLKINTKE
ncbi:hypothetical protein MGH68_15540 [Erysipelothrix sp. D19-032]